MIARVKQQLVRLGLAGLLPVLLLAPAAAVNAQDPIQDFLCGGAENLSISPDNCEDAGAEDAFNSLVITVINIFSAIVGIIAVIIIIYAGFRYITSAGDSGKISAAQQSIIYAIVGLVVVALAQIIVRFVLSQATEAGAS